MDGLVFQPLPAPRASHPARADIACFVGFVARRSGATLSESENADLAARGWLGGAAARPVGEVQALLQVPVTVDSWDAFDRLFSWETRQLNSGTLEICPSALGAAVRSFFAQGGRRCHVVRCGNPLAADAPLAARTAQLEALLPSGPFLALEPASWKGVYHLLGLADTSFLCLPDLPELFGPDTVVRRPPVVPDSEERFVPLAAGAVVPEPAASPLASLARCDAAGFAAWAKFVRRVGALLARGAREVQCIAALPRPVDEAALGGNARSADIAAAIRAARDAQWSESAGLDTAFVQLAYPWLRTPTARDLPGSCEAPDGTLAGALAHHALVRGTWSSALRRPVLGINSVDPVLDRAALERPLDRADPNSATVRERITLFGPIGTGIVLLSDVTTQRGTYRPANLNRLVAALVRAARLVGEESVFENNGETLWRRLVDRLNDLLTGLWREGIFAGASPAEAFEVACDRTTMTQADLDAGRAIVRIAFTSAAPIERIVIQLALDEGGHVSLLGKDADLHDA